MDLTRLRPEDYRPAPPPEAIRQRYGIGLVGCGGIARGAHLPAYRDFGYRVVGACDVVEAHARARPGSTASRSGRHAWSDLLARPEVDVIDLAVHAAQRRPLVEQIAAAGKHDPQPEAVRPHLGGRPAAWWRSAGGRGCR